MFLKRILAHKREEVARQKQRVPLAELERRLQHAPPARPFRASLESAPGLAVIAEVKRASPSKGLIRADFDPVRIAEAYEAGGAAAISVLTDENFFKGSLAHLEAVRQHVSLPVLRKEFIIDAYQLVEARAAGADAALLIAACLPEPGRLEALLQEAERLGLEALVEVHDAGEMKRAARAGARLIGINNRDLHSFETRLEVTEELAPLAPPQALLVGESGIHGPGDAARLAQAGVRAVLVGEHLMRAEDPGAELRELAAVGAPLS